MNILFVSALLPYPLLSGGQIRIYNLLKQVSKHHSVTLCAFIRNEEEREYVRHLDFVRVIPVYRGKRLRLPYLIRFFLGDSLLTASYTNSTMRKIIADELAAGQYDLLHLEPFYVSPSVPQTDIPTVVCEHNIEFRVYEEYAKSNRILMPLMALEAKRIKQKEIDTVTSCDRLITVSGSDREYWKKTVGKTHISVVPNGVDVTYYRYIIRKKTRQPNFLFVGNFNWLPNRSLLKPLLYDIWPRIHEALPASTLTIVGKNIPGVISGDHVVTKNTIDDIRAEYESADILLAPTDIAGGSKYKIIEAMASGLPVLTTSQGLGGLAARDGVHAYTATSPDEYVRQSVSILTQTKKTTGITGNARKLIESEYGWEAIGKKLEDAWEKTQQ